MPAIKNSEKQLITGLDIGSSKVSVIVCESSDNSEMEIIGVSEKSTEGMRKGMVSNIDLMVRSIEQAIIEAEMMSARTIDRVYAGITGTHIRSYNSTGVVAIRGSEVNQDDVNRVIESARAVKKSSDENILHVLPQAFTIDDHTGIKNPIGLSGIRLEVKVHVVTANTSAVQNILKCVNMCELDVAEIILDHIASSHAVLTEDEKELGIGLLDIGDGTTDLAVYNEGAIQHSTTFPIAGAQVTNDIAIILHTPTDSAKKIKHRYGFAVSNLLDKDQNIELPAIGDHQMGSVKQSILAQVIQARVEEIFQIVNHHITANNLWDTMRSGIVLTGGTSKLAGMESLAEQYFKVPVRLGYPRYKGSLSEVIRHPMFSTAIGLCEFGLTNECFHAELRQQEENEHGARFFSRMLDGLRREYRKPEIKALPSASSDRVKGWLESEY